MSTLTITPYPGGSLPSSAYPLLAPNGTAGAPSYSFVNFPTTGMYTDSNIQFAVGGANIVAIDAAGVLIKSNAGRLALGASSDVVLAWSAANTLSLLNGNNAQEFRVYAGNGGFISNVKTVTESLTIAAAATTTSATSIPAGAILLGVSVRVTTVIPTAATFTITTTVGGTTLNTAAVSTAATSTDPGTAAGASYRAAATTVVITPNLTPGAATGVVRLQYYYLQITPATS